jgi:lysophospholipase L1-like esterase
VTERRTVKATCPFPSLEPEQAGQPDKVTQTSARRQNDYIAALTTGPKVYDLVFVGDSITFGWTAAESSKTPKFPRGAKEWSQKYTVNGVAGFNFLSRAYNAGIGQDRIQSVLWRVKGGKASDDRTQWPMSDANRYFATKRHKIAVLMIGTNNLRDIGNDYGPGSEKVQNTVDGIKAIVDEIRTQSDLTTKVLVLGILPRSGSNADKAAKAMNAKLALEYPNNTAATTGIKFLDMRSSFVRAGDVQDYTLFGDGRPNDSTDPIKVDQIHPNLAGYRKMGVALRTVLVGASSWGGLV